MFLESKRKRRGISPVLAEVILIAITLIAAVAITGFVFGLFSSFTHTAEVMATVVSCDSGSTNSCTLTLSNTGTASVNVIAGSISYGGATYSLTGYAGTVTAGSSLTRAVAWTGGGTASAGEGFTGSVALANGGSVPFTGIFQ
jgi:archaeal type IV pilus assembly protein PilA